MVSMNSWRDHHESQVSEQHPQVAIDAMRDG
jgi:hypothetical protein